ncbi:MAG: arginine--tRNA ligase [Fervidicoccaceae archaeon]
MAIDDLKPMENYIYIRIIETLKKSLNDLLPQTSFEREYLIAEPPENVEADISYPLSREKIDKNMYDRISEEIGKRFISEVEIEAKSRILNGYLNISFDRKQYTEAFLKEFFKYKSEYGRHKNAKLKILVEHTSANPVHPLHLGHGRNSSLGDTLAKLLKFYGIDVETRFYIDDVGRQVATLIYGLTNLIQNNIEEMERFSRGWKIDHWIGRIYAITNLLVELNILKREIKSADEEKYKELIKKQDEIVGELFRFREELPEIFDALSEKILSDEDPEKKIATISLHYERGDPVITERYRFIVKRVLEGFRETLEKMNIKFDKWDWESDLIWSGAVEKVLEQARASPFFSLAKGSEGLDFTSILTNEVRELLKIPKEMDIPPLVLKRSDGTTLYTTRDIAYSIFKFKDSGADYVINVVGKEQMLPQAQIRLALYVLGYENLAKRLIHYSYEMVNLQGFKMSGRRGRYVSLDDLLERAEEMALLELKKRNREMSEDEAKKASEKVGRGAVRHFMVSVSADKPMTIRLEDIINFEKNSGPYLQYTFARANNLLRKAGDIKNTTPRLCSEIDSLTWKIVKKASEFPYVIYKSSRELKPELLVSYTSELSQKFNKWYDAVPVIGEPNPDCREMKVGIVTALKTIFSNSLEILGMEAPERI